MVRAAVYARISSDDGTALGVGRQVKDCRKLAADLGWSVVEEYTDNDISAYSGKKRPSYERMLADIGAGAIDAVIVYHVDRLTRRPIELEQFLEVVTSAGVQHVRFVAGGDLDPGNGDGLLVVRLLCIVGAGESATKSRRVRRSMDDKAAQGLPHGGPRPFGFEDDRITHRPEEAAVIRTVVSRYLAGESTASLTTWLQQGQDVPPASGKTWSTTTVRNMLRSERNAGLRVHNGETVPATWKPIVNEADRQRVLARMSRNAATGKRTPRRYLLSGLLRCSDCGHKLYSERRKDKGRYACRSGPDFGGCGKRSIVAGPVEDLVTAAVLYRLDTPELADALTGRAAEDDKTAALAEDLAADRVQLVELAQLYGDKLITAREWIEARNPIEARITNTERRLARQTRSDALTGWVGNSDALRSAWDDLNLTVRAAIISSIVDHADIAPGQRGARELDPNRVDIVWRL